MSLSRIGYLLIALILCAAAYYHIKYQRQDTVDLSPNIELPVFSGKALNNTSYNKEGIRSYVITSQSMDHFAKSGDTVFQRPVLKVFKDGNTLEWEIEASNGVLNQEHVLILSNDVLVKNLLDESGFDTLSTDSMKIRLDNRDFWADNQVIIKGPQFNTIGQAMRGNFADHNATLYNSVQGRYETFTP